MSTFASWFRTMHKQFQGNSVLRASSESLPWSDVTLQVYEADAAERPEIFVEHPTLALFMNRSAVRIDRRDAQGNITRETKRPGSSVLLHPGPVQSIRSISKIHLVVCGIDRHLLDEVAHEAREGINWAHLQTASARTGKELHFEDRALSRIAELIQIEAKEGGRSGALYIEHLSHALALRTASLMKVDKCSSARPTPAVPNRVLRRVLDKIKADISADHRLAGLAAEAGYSRSHFLRAFTASVGMPPHQYIVRLRLNSARQLLMEGSSNIAEIAVRCGFASDAHLSRAFHRYYGVPPSVYRRARRCA